MFTCFFALPANPLGEGMVECNGTRFRAHSYTAPSVPTLLRIEDDGRLTLFRIGNEEIHLAYLYTGVASITDIRVKHDRISRRAPVGKSIHLFLRHPFPP
jgi:hypothetical protein